MAERKAFRKMLPPIIIDGDLADEIDAIERDLRVLHEGSTVTRASVIRELLWLGIDVGKAQILAMKRERARELRERRTAKAKKHGLHRPLGKFKSVAKPRVRKK